MNAVIKDMIFERHPWLAHFEQAPEKAFGDLLAGYADIHPYQRADAPDAAHMLFGPLAPEDRARSALGPAILSWLDKRRKEPLPRHPNKLQNRVRQVCEAFEIIALLQVADAAVVLRRNTVIWNNWVARLVVSTARDARAEFWRMLGLTQHLVAAADPAVNANGLAPMWLSICREAGGRLPKHYLSIGLLGLRRLPAGDDSSELPWISGLAQWAAARDPSDKEFKAQWLGLKPLYPRAPERWRKLVAQLLSAPAFREADIAAPAWWRVDSDFAPMLKDNFKKTRDAPLDWPSRDDCLDVIKTLGDPFSKVEPQIDALFDKHRRYVRATGDAQWMVRAIHLMGRGLLEEKGDVPDARARKAQALAREGLRWLPYDRHCWALWREALEAEGALDAAELIAWERIRHDASDVDGHTQLVTLLANSFGKLDDAERILREAITKFPNDAHARSQLAELLIARDRVPEATNILNEALKADIAVEGTYAARARIYSNQGYSGDAMRTIKDGIRFLESKNPPIKIPALKHYEALLERNQNIPLKSKAFQRTERRSSPPSGIADPELVEATRLGLVRRLRFVIESGTAGQRGNALEELRAILRDDPTFAYAELLAARHGIWEAQADTLPSFATAFEVALATEDRQILEELASRQPRLESLIVVAQAMLGDLNARQKMEAWLRRPDTPDRDQAIVAFRQMLRPVLVLIDGGKSVEETLAAKRGLVIDALHDANEALVGDMMLAA